MAQDFAVVLAGGGSRGAYEAGVLSVLLPALEKHGATPTVFVGTSAGAINAVGFASLHHLGAAACSQAVLELWRQVHFGSVFRSPVRTAVRRLAGRGAGGRRAGALLDTTPLIATLEHIVDWDQLHANVASGKVAAVGVVATPSSTRDSTVFVETAGDRCPPVDDKRAIRYVKASLAADHVRASSAMPVVFPAVEILNPEVAAGWYFDGGARLNTPIKPALALGASRVLVVATAPAEAPVDGPHTASSPPPGIAGGAAELFYAILADRMIEDLRALAGRNEPSADGDLVPWTFGGPRRDDDGLFGRLVCEVLGGAGPGPRRRRGPLSVVARRALGRVLAHDPDRAELASYLFFDPDFIDGAIRLGQRDAETLLGPDGGPVWHEVGGAGTPTG